MILNRLYEFAQNMGLLDHAAFEEVAVPFVLQIDAGGRFLGIDGHKAKPKKGEPRHDRVLSVPRPHGNPASQGFARFFVDTLPRVLPIVTEEKNRAKEERSRATFWGQLAEAASATRDEALTAITAFGASLSDEQVVREVREAVVAKKVGSGDRVTFAYFPDGGPSVVERSSVRSWYAEFFKQFTASKQVAGPMGFCTITGSVVPLPTSHPIKLTGIPGGLATGVRLVSFDKAAFRHYGLEGAACAGIGYEAADGYARGFQWLRGHHDHHFVVGGTLFLFWTHTPCDLGFISLLVADASQIRTALTGLYAGSPASVASMEQNEFYLLAVSGNSARAVVRDYLERPLSTVQNAVTQWFFDLQIADISKSQAGKPNGAFPLWMLSTATAKDSNRVTAETESRLAMAACAGTPLPDSIMAACLSRLRAEGDKGFHPARMGLIKLCLNRNARNHGESLMSESLNDDELHPAYLYGRLLRLFEEIQYSALGDINASVVDKFYGTFSAAPALVFARLFSNSQNHLRKLRNEKPGLAAELDRRLSEVTSRLPAAPPAGTLPLADQGRFALGYYHQKAQTFAAIAERKLARTQSA